MTIPEPMTIAPAETTGVVEQPFTPYGYNTDPGVVAAAPAYPLPPYHVPAGQVTEAEFDALEARVAALEAAP